MEINNTKVKRSMGDRRKADRRIRQVPVMLDTRSEGDRRQGDRRSYASAHLKPAKDINIVV